MCVDLAISLPYPFPLYNIALDLISHARGFALLHLPKMPELKTVDCTAFDPYSMPPQCPSLTEAGKGREKKKHIKDNRHTCAVGVAVHKPAAPDKVLL